jgi:uncharacterized glyoxalase superfamily protein PhnB
VRAHRYPVATGARPADGAVPRGWTRRALSGGATVVQEPVDQSYGYRVYGARDLEGHLWSLMRPLD